MLNVAYASSEDVHFAPTISYIEYTAKKTPLLGIGGGVKAS
jgi:hypothetical protein